MTVIISNLNLTKYSVDDLKNLYKMQIISKGELINELVERGCEEFLAVMIARSVRDTERRTA